MHCPGHAGVTGKDRADTLAGKATFTSSLMLLGRRSEVLRSMRHYLQAQSQEHHTIDHLQERGVERESARRSSDRERTRKGGQIVNLWEKHWNSFKGNVGDTQTGWSAYGLFFLERIDTIFIWTKQAQWRWLISTDTWLDRPTLSCNTACSECRGRKYISRPNLIPPPGWAVFASVMQVHFCCCFFLLENLEVI